MHSFSPLSAETEYDAPVFQTVKDGLEFCYENNLFKICYRLEKLRHNYKRIAVFRFDMTFPPSGPSTGDNREINKFFSRLGSYALEKWCKWHYAWKRIQPQVGPQYYSCLVFIDAEVVSDPLLFWQEVHPIWEDVLGTSAPETIAFIEGADYSATEEIIILGYHDESDTLTVKQVGEADRAGQICEEWYKEIADIDLEDSTPLCVNRFCVSPLE